MEIGLAIYINKEGRKGKILYASQMQSGPLSFVFSAV